jgi:hypothetical protein
MFLGRDAYGHFGGWVARKQSTYAVIPGWFEGPDPESRDSGFALRAPRNDGKNKKAPEGAFSEFMSLQ